MQATGATLIFATTTPVPPKNKAKRTPESVRRFNAAAAAMMRQRGVQVNDLYAAIAPHMDSMGLKNDVHFGRDGYSLLGKTAGQAILAVLDGGSPRQFDDATRSEPAAAARDHQSMTICAACHRSHRPHLTPWSGNGSRLMRRFMPRQRAAQKQKNTQTNRQEMQASYHNVPETFANALIVARIMTVCQRDEPHHHRACPSNDLNRASTQTAQLSTQLTEHLYQAGWQHHPAALTVNAELPKQTKAKMAGLPTRPRRRRLAHPAPLHRTTAPTNILYSSQKIVRSLP